MSETRLADACADQGWTAAPSVDIPVGVRERPSDPDTGGLDRIRRALAGRPSVRLAHHRDSIRTAAEAFAAYLDQTRLPVEQIRFVSMIVEELTANGIMEPARLYESPYIDNGHVDVIFPEDVDLIVDILREVNEHASPRGAA